MEELTKQMQSEKGTFDIEIPLDALLAQIPDLTERAIIAAQDPLACVYAFNVLCQIALSALFGVRCCSDCPACGCRDSFGSVAKPNGGVFGRMDAYYGAKEGQKAGNLHLHLLAFLQSLHQHSSVDELVSALRLNPSIVDDFFAFKNHCDNEQYSDPEKFAHQRDTLEKDWPLYETHSHLLLQPEYDGTMQADRWRKTYFSLVQRTQQMLNHHVHPLQPDGERTMLPGCITKSNPTECRARYPRKLDAAMCYAKNAVLCGVLAKSLKLKTSGKRNATGAVIGLRNNEWLNGGHPALLMNLRCNCDTLISWRLPVMPQTHTMCVSDECMTDANIQECVKAVRRCQRDQCGYISDYASKKQPMAREAINVLEVSFNKLHTQVLQEIQPRATKRRFARRHTQRVMSDLYARSMHRMATETCNLLVSRGLDKTDAESKRSAQVTSFFCDAYVRSFDYPDKEWQSRLVWNRQNGKKVGMNKIPAMSYCYGHRGKHPFVRWMCPYEFQAYYKIVQVRVPSSKNPHHPGKYHATLTEPGICKISESGPSVKLTAAVDYIVDAPGNAEWLPFDERSGLQHEWVMERRSIVAVPSFTGVVFPRNGTKEEQGRRMCIYFRPWTMIKEESDSDVPFASDMKLPDTPWTQCFEDYCLRVPSYFMKRVIVNFQGVYSLRVQEQLDNDGEIVPMELFEWTNVEKEEMKETQMRQIRANGTYSDDPRAAATFRIIRDNWGSLHSNANTKSYPKSFGMPIPDSHKEVLKEARRQITEENKQNVKDELKSHEQVPSMTIENRNTNKVVADWRQQQSATANVDQMEFVNLVADRLVQEDKELFDGDRGKSEPLSMLVTGGPGTGKSFITDSMKKVFDQLGWKQGREYEFVAFQAAVAAVSAGETMHRSSGIRVGKAKENSAYKKRNKSSLRWYIIDEISQVRFVLLWR